MLRPSHAVTCSTGSNRDLNLMCVLQTIVLMRVCKADLGPSLIMQGLLLHLPFVSWLLQTGSRASASGPRGNTCQLAVLQWQWLGSHLQSDLASCLADCCTDAAVHLLLVYVPLGAARAGPHSSLGRRRAALQHVWPPHAQTSRLCHHPQAHIATRSTRGQPLDMSRHRNSSVVEVCI